MAIIQGRILYIDHDRNDDDLGVNIILDDKTYGSLLSSVITDTLREEYKDKSASWEDETSDEDFENGLIEKSKIQNVQLSFHACDNPITYDEAQEKLALLTIGELDTTIEWYGYSEYTILGYETASFTLGGHDLEEIFKQHDGKYVVIEVCIADEGRL